MTKIFAHRGSAGTHPENTMTSFLEAERVGADGIEMDVHMTKDNELAVIHDNTVDRTTNGTGWVRAHTLKELQALDAGSWFAPEFRGDRILSLSEFLQWIKGTNLEINIELKYVALDYDNFEERVIGEIEKFNLVHRTILSSYNHYALKKINQLNPEIECGVLYMARLYEPWDYAASMGAKALHSYKLVTERDMIAGALKRDYNVRVYTVNDEQLIGKFIKDGCSAIITDYPKRAVEVRKMVEAKKSVKAE